MVDPALLLPDGIGASAAALLVIASFFTSAVTASFGLGGGVMMLALMGLFVPVTALIPVQGLVQLGSNTGRAYVQRAHVRRSIMTPFLAGSLIGAIVGGYTVVQLPDALMKTMLGAFILVITWVKIPGLKSLGNAGLAISSGIISCLSMFLGATGPLMVSVLGAMIHDDRKALVATSAAAMTVHHGLKVIVFGIAGFAFGDWLPLIAAMIATGYAGTLTGSKLLSRIPEDKFRLAFKIILTLLALQMLFRGLYPTV
ncbi:MAG: sulfite exporter TauE/SafE family protein [Rhizobiaceae bacterium]